MGAKLGAAFDPNIYEIRDFYKDGMPAYVFGGFRRYCSMRDGVCRAKIARIAADLYLNYDSVTKYAKMLVRDGFLIDLTPDAKNRPHIYKDPKKYVQVTVIVKESELDQDDKVNDLDLPDEITDKYVEEMWNA